MIGATRGIKGGMTLFRASGGMLSLKGRRFVTEGKDGHC